MGLPEVNYSKDEILWWEMIGRRMRRTWQSLQITKNEFDLRRYFNLLSAENFGVVVEIGINHGGSAAFFMDSLDMLGHEDVPFVGVDISPPTFLVHTHPYEIYIGGSTDNGVVEKVLRRIEEKKALFILDSDHCASHVYAELHYYAAALVPGSVLVVEDTELNGHPVVVNFGPGPWEAINRFLAENPTMFEPIPLEYGNYTTNPGGWLRRVGG